MKKIELLIKRISNFFEDIPLPHYATEGSSGIDIRAALKEDIIIAPGKRTTGCRIKYKGTFNRVFVH